MPTPEELAREQKETVSFVSAFYNRACGSRARWTLGPHGSRAGPRVINGAAGKRCDMDGKPEGSCRGDELINVQHLTSNKLDGVCRVTICTIQRLYAMLRSLWLNKRSRRGGACEETGDALREFDEPCSASSIAWISQLFAC
jgi:hypothetical protein